MHPISRCESYVVRIIVAVMLTVLLFGGTPGEATSSLPGEGRTLIFAYGNWTGDWLPIMVSRILLEDHLGYEIEIADLAIPAIWAMVDAGNVDVWVNAWFPNQDYLMERYEQNVEVVSWHYFEEALQGWAVPTWFAEEHGLERVQDLDDPAIARLLDRDGDGTGDLFGCEVGWTCHDHNEFKLESYDLDQLYKQVDASETMINYTIMGAIDADQPVLFYRWTPDWIFALYPYPDTVTVLRDPVGAWREEGAAEPDEFGWPPGSAGTLVNRAFQDDHPEAYALLSQISVPLDAVNESVFLQVVEEETSTADLLRHAEEWLAANETTVDEWLQAAGLR